MSGKISDRGTATFRNFDLNVRSYYGENIPPLPPLSDKSEIGLPPFPPFVRRRKKWLTPLTPVVRNSILFTSNLSKISQLTRRRDAYLKKKNSKVGLVSFER